MIFTFNPFKKMLNQQKWIFVGLQCVHTGVPLFLFFLRRTLVLNKATVSRGFKFLLVYKPSPASTNDF